MIWTYLLDGDWTLVRTVGSNQQSLSRFMELKKQIGMWYQNY